MATASRSSANQHLDNFKRGLESAFNWPKTFILFYSSSTVQTAMLKVLVLNGILFLGTVVFLEHHYRQPHHHLFGCPYSMLLGYPLYFALLVINGRFYAKVAEKSYQLQNKNQQQAKSAPSIAQSLATTIYMSIFYANCGVFATLLRMIPNIGIFLSFIMNCFILAYYSFEFRWLYMQWPLEKRLAYVEQHWSFFLGFGLPGTVTTFFLSSLRAGAMFALFYPSFIIMAFMALPSPTSASGVPASLSVTSGTEFMLPNTVPVFYPVRQMNKVVIQLVKLIGGVRVESIMANKKTANVESERKAQ